MMYVAQNPALSKCDDRSLMMAVVDSFATGLELGGVRPLCYLIPYGNDCRLHVDYRGWLELCRRTGQLDKFVVDVVRKGDQISVVSGLDERIEHVKSLEPTSDRPITHVYAAFRLKNGNTVQEIWDVDRVIEHAKRYSKSYNSPDSPWQTRFEPMAMKTLILQLFYRGRLPISEAITNSLNLEQVSNENEDVVDAEEWVERPRIEEQPKSKSEPKEPTEPSGNWPDAYKALQDELATASRPVAVKSIEDKFSEIASSDEERFEVQSACKSRVDEIAGQEANA